MPAPYNKDVGADEIAKDFASQIKGKVILTTGVSPGGLGASFVETVAKQSPSLLILAGRTTSKLEATAKKIAEINPDVKTRLLQLDTGSFKSVKVAAEEVNKYSENIDVLVNNAGIMGTQYAKTDDGYESQWQVNHLGPFLFTNLIIDKILAGADGGRVIMVSSDGYRLGHVRHYDYNFHDGESYHEWTAYGQSKTANVLFAKELAKRLGQKGLQAYSIHPGVIWTNLPGGMKDGGFDSLVAWDKKLGMARGWEEFQVLDLNQGVALHTYASFAPDIKKSNGGFFCSHFEKLPTPDEDLAPWAVGEIEQRKTWELSEKLVGQKFDFK